jgi:hypothetical protein
MNNTSFDRLPLLSLDFSTQNNENLYVEEDVDKFAVGWHSYQKIRLHLPLGDLRHLIRRSKHAQGWRLLSVDSLTLELKLLYFMECNRDNRTEVLALDT